MVGVSKDAPAAQKRWKGKLGLPFPLLSDADTEVQQAWARQGAVPLAMDPQAFDRYIQADVQKWAKVIRSANIKAD